MAIWMMIIAAVMGAGSNLSMRKSIDAGGSSKAFLIFQLTVSALVAFLLNPVRTGYFGIEMPAVWLGILAGIFLFALMWSMGSSMENGPPGLTLATVNAATVMPAIVMALIFGSPYTPTAGIGSLMVVAGLFWAGWTSTERQSRWVKLITLAFVSHVALLCVLQWRAMMLTREASQWFNPILFVTASALMFIYYLKKERRRPKLIEGVYGTFGGLLNGVCIFLLVVAPEVATPLQNSMIFPLFAVAVILLNNLWGQALYKERINWAANGLCIAGVIVGCVNWSAILTR